MDFEEYIKVGGVSKLPLSELAKVAWKPNKKSSVYYIDGKILDFGGLKHKLFHEEGKAISTLYVPEIRYSELEGEPSGSFLVWRPTEGADFTDRPQTGGDALSVLVIKSPTNLVKRFYEELKEEI